MADSGYVVEVTAQSFHQIVIEGSRERLVLVDFWADWCAPCHMLAPVLAAVADAYNGRLLVAKVNTEEEQALAAEFGIRSLPTVQIFKDGKPIDQFMGALPESQVRAFVERHLPHESEELLAKAQSLLKAGDLEGAAGLIDRARKTDPQNARIRLAEAGIHAAEGDTQGALEMLDNLPIELSGDPQVASLRGQLDFAALQADSPPEKDLISRLEADPQDSDARYRLAAHLVVRADYEEALKQLLELMKGDRAFQEDAGRKGMLSVFAILGGEGELVTRYRSRMLNALY
jgi:putative thioredoxin